MVQKEITFTMWFSFLLFILSFTNYKLDSHPSKAVI